MNWLSLLIPQAGALDAYTIALWVKRIGGPPGNPDGPLVSEYQPLPYRIISKNRSSQVSSLMSMNLLAISVTMLMIPM